MSPAYLSYPGSYIFLYTKHGKPFKWDAQVGLARRVNPPSITLEEKARFPSSGGLHWYVTSPIYENPITLSGGSRPPPLFLDQTEKIFLETIPSLHPPPPLSEGLDLRLTLNGKSVLILLLGLIIYLYSLNAKRNREMQVSKFSCWLPPVFVLQALFWSPSTVQC